MLCTFSEYAYVTNRKKYRLMLCTCFTLPVEIWRSNGFSSQTWKSQEQEMLFSTKARQSVQIFPCLQIVLYLQHVLILLRKNSYILPFVDLTTYQTFNCSVFCFFYEKNMRTNILFSAPSPQVFYLSVFSTWVQPLIRLNFLHCWSK